MIDRQAVAYYPGCSLHGLARPYDRSTKLVCAKLELDLREVPDWNCCGATSGHSINRELTLALGARNLSQVMTTGAKIVTSPCAACYSSLVRVADELRDPATRAKAEELIEAAVGEVKVMHLLELLTRPEVVVRLEQKVSHRLQNLRVVCYYGCLIVRPYRITGFDDPENPQVLDRLLRNLGAEVLDWSHKTECCGASFSVCGPEMADQRTDEILRQARQVGAEAIVVACPLCQSNLEFRQASLGGDWNMPVIFFTQLIGLALGMSVKEVGLHQLLGDAFPWREKIKPV
ncbi:MAG: CoB--CoM heterodisulfide reductase iron-sulfur subunit B family protein [Firmicutes bacterium]|nr:CoB--CoM heterodisulfide reductase iron-sulfur subunit B family protein [Bacillota bacterium]